MNHLELNRQKKEKKKHDQWVTCEFMVVLEVKIYSKPRLAG